MLPLVIIVASVISSLTCLCWILIKCGCICRKPINEDEMDFDQVELDTPAKHKERKRVIIRGG